MNKIIFLNVLCISFYIIVSCQPTKQQVITEKNKCYDEKLEKLKTTSLYQQVFFQFRDTFEILKQNKENFGLSDFVESKIDGAIFFNKDSSECFLTVLQKDFDTLYAFGGTKIVYGKVNHGKWYFSPGMDKTFAKDYFKLYNENNFENISKLARYSVLTDGNIKRKGCEIDEYYWFVHMNQ